MKKIVFADFLKKDPLKDLADYGFGLSGCVKKETTNHFLDVFSKRAFF